MTFQFRPAVRENVGLLIGLIGPSGSGKTYSAMRLASGIAAGKPFAVIDTEARRALHYADKFNFHHAELHPPFRPAAYVEAIQAADAAGYPVIVVDSMSHEWAGEGGILDWQEQELTRMAGDDYRKREACKMAAWIKPKMAHKAMVQRLLQVKAHLILCHRAEEKVEMVKGQDGKTQIVPKGWQPICAKDFPYELTASFLLLPDQPGIPHPIKLQEQHRALFPIDRPITEASGHGIAKWASSGAAPRTDPVTTEATLAPVTGKAAAVDPPAAAAPSPAARPGLVFVAGHNQQPVATIGAWLDIMEDALANDPGALDIWDANLETFGKIVTAATRRKEQATIERCEAMKNAAHELVKAVNGEVPA